MGNRIQPNGVIADRNGSSAGRGSPPVQERLLSREEMLSCRGGQMDNLRAAAEAKDAINQINHQNPYYEQEKKQKDIALWGLAPVGNTDSTRTSALQTTLSVGGWVENKVNQISGWVENTYDAAKALVPEVWDATKTEIKRELGW